MSIRSQLKDFSTWAGIVGWVTVIGGAINALFGLLAFIVGAIPGVVTVILGLKLLGAKKHAMNLVHSEESNDTEMFMMVKELTTYFKIQGVLIIIGVIGFALMFGLGFLSMLAM